MANLRDAKVILKNAQALELFMRVSPTMPSFLHHFKVDKNNSPRLLFSYEIPCPDAPDYDPRIEMAAIACEAYMQQLKSFLAIDPKKQFKTDGLYYDINLADTGLKDKILDLTVQLINAERKKNPAYTLSHFPTKENAPEGYDGLIDSDKLYDALSRGMPEKVNRKYLQTLLPEMNHLGTLVREAKLPERYR